MLLSFNKYFVSRNLTDHHRQTVSATKTVRCDMELPEILSVFAKSRAEYRVGNKGSGNWRPQMGQHDHVQWKEKVSSLSQSWLPDSKKICHAPVRLMLMAYCAFSCSQNRLYFLSLSRFCAQPCKTLTRSVQTYHKLTPQFVQLQSGRWGGLLLLLPGTGPPTSLQFLELPRQFLHFRNCQRQLFLLFIEKGSNWVQVWCCRNTQKVSMNSVSINSERREYSITACHTAQCKGGMWR